MKPLKALMWGSAALIGWSYVGYPAAASLAGRLRRYAPRADGSIAPDAALVIAAYNEEDEIAETLEHALALDYPGRLEILVASDGSTDGTAAEVARFADRGVRLLELPREGKVAAQNAAVAATSADLLAFSDANARLQPAALRLLARNLADPEVGYVCGRLALEDVGAARTAKVSTGASSSGCGRPNRRAAPSPAGTAPSTRCGEAPISSSGPSEVTTSASRFASAAWACARSTSLVRSRASARSRGRRTSGRARSACSRAPGPRF